MYVEVAAHRGNVAEYPENTMLAYKSAYEIGADMIELDLHMTKDGEIVLIHDGELARTADVSGRINELTLEEILRADVGIKRGAEARELPVRLLLGGRGPEGLRGGEGGHVRSGRPRLLPRRPHRAGDQAPAGAGGLSDRGLRGRCLLRHPDGGYLRLLPQRRDPPRLWSGPAGGPGGRGPGPGHGMPGGTRHRGHHQAGADQTLKNT